MDGSSGLDPRDLTRELLASLYDAATVDEFLVELTRSAARAVDAAQSCGLTLWHAGRHRPAGATSDDLARRMDQLQYDLDDGPCLRCVREGVPVVVPDIAADRRWPAFTRRAHHEGVGTSMSVPMVVGGRPVGALNLYGRRPHCLAEPELAEATRFADGSATVVGLATRVAELEDTQRHLQSALASRSTIDQAIGVLRSERRWTAAEAFDALRRRSQHRNVKLRAVAAEILAEIGDDR